MSKEQAKGFFEAISKDKQLAEEVNAVMGGQATNQEKAKELLSLAKRRNFNFTEDELKMSLSVEDLADVSGGMFSLSLLSRLGLSVLNMFGFGGGGNQPAPQPETPMVNVQQVADNAQNEGDENEVHPANIDEEVEEIRELTPEEIAVRQRREEQHQRELEERIAQGPLEIINTTGSLGGTMSAQDVLFSNDNRNVLQSRVNRLLELRNQLQALGHSSNLMDRIQTCINETSEVIRRQRGNFDLLLAQVNGLIQEAESSLANMSTDDNQQQIQHRLDALNEIVQRTSLNDVVRISDWLKKYNDIKNNMRLTPNLRKEKYKELFEEAKEINKSLEKSEHPLFIHKSQLNSILKKHSDDKKAERIKGNLDVFSQKWSSCFLRIDDESDEIKWANQMQECEADLADSLTKSDVMAARDLLENFLEWLYQQVESEHDKLLTAQEECDDDSKVHMSNALRLYLDMEEAFVHQGRFGDMRLWYGTNQDYSSALDEEDRSVLTKWLTAARELLVNSAPRYADFDDVRGVTGVDVSGVDGEIRLAAEIREFLNATGGNFTEQNIKTMDEFLDRARELLLQRARTHTQFDSDQSDIHRNDLQFAHMLGIDGQYVQEKVKNKMTESNKDIKGSIQLADGDTVKYHFFTDSGTLLLTGSGNTVIGPNGEYDENGWGQAFYDSFWWQFRDNTPIRFAAEYTYGSDIGGHLPTERTPFIVRNLIIGDGISEIGDNAFREQLSLRSVYFLGQVQRVGSFAFARGFDTYETVVSILEAGFAHPEQLREIGDGVFEDNNKFTSSNMPNRQQHE